MHSKLKRLTMTNTIGLWSFRLGTKFFVHQKTRIPGSSKVQWRLVGQFEVLGQVGNIAYKLWLTGKVKVVHTFFHMSLSHPYLPDVTHKGPPNPITAGEYQEYNIERIVMHKKTKTRLSTKSDGEVMMPWRKAG